MKHARHGMSGTPEYQVWKNMRSRCYYDRDKKYADYGGRGIRVCVRWRESFADFIADMGMRPAPEYRIDRKDNDANYACGKCEECTTNGWASNCQWITHQQNQLNKRTSVTRVIDGTLVYLAALDSEVPVDVIAKRLDKGIPLQLATKRFATGRMRSSGAIVEIGGVSKPVGEWCRVYAVPYDTWRCRLKRGIAPDVVFTMAPDRVRRTCAKAKAA